MHLFICSLSAQYRGRVIQERLSETPWYQHNHMWLHYYLGAFKAQNVLALSAWFVPLQPFSIWNRISDSILFTFLYLFSVTRKPYETLSNCLTVVELGELCPLLCSLSSLSGEKRRRRRLTAQVKTESVRLNPNWITNGKIELEPWQQEEGMQYACLCIWMGCLGLTMAVIAGNCTYRPAFLVSVFICTSTCVCTVVRVLYYSV